MKLKNLLFVLCIVSMQNLFAQSWSYVNTEEYFAMANDILEDGDGNILICGGSFSWPYSGSGPTRITKLDASGNLLWETEIESPVAIGEITANDMDITDDGYIIFCGGFDKPLIVKLSFSGDVIWTTETWCAALETAACPRSFGYVSSDGSITMIGPDGYYMDINIYKVDADGNLIDEISYPMSSPALGNIVEVWEGQESSDGGFAITGGIVTTGGTYCPFVTKYDSDGNIAWSSNFTSFSGSDSYGISSTTDDGFIICGSNPFGGSVSAICMDAAGTETWSNSYDATDASHLPYAYDVAQRTDGSYVLGINNYDNLFVYYGNSDIVYIDDAGDETSRITIAGGDANTIQSIIGTSDGGFAFAYHFGVDDYVAGDWDARYSAQKSSPSGELPVCVYNCVWPGDGDNNGTANSDDILAIGLSYGNSGALRPDGSIDWYAHGCEEWATTLPDGTNNKYTDGNGDGTINDDDTSAVIANYSSEHAVVSLKTSSDIPLYVEDPMVILPAGYNSLKIRLGDAANMIDAIYGLRFTIEFSGDAISEESVSINFGDSWFGVESEMIQFKKLFADSYQIDAAVVKTDKVNSDGYGDIGTLSFVLIDNIAGKENEVEELTFTITDVRAIDVDMNEITVEGMATIVNADATDISLNNENLITVFPNPSINGMLYLNHAPSIQIEEVVITDLTGREIKTFTENEIQSNQLLVQNLADGNYLIKIRTSDNMEIQKITILK